MPRRGSQAVGPMSAAGEESNGVDAYIAAAPATIQPVLRELRALIRSTAPSAVEKLSYGMPSYEYHGRFVHFAGYKSHLGVYGLVHVDRPVSDELTPYLDHRSTLRLSLDRPLPAAAIREALRRRMTENESKDRDRSGGVAPKL